MHQSTRFRAPWLAAASFLLVGLAIANYPAHAQSLDSSGVRAVPTYEAVGLYWSSPGANSTTGCEVKFRASGTTAWTQGLNLWFDSSNNECRGSLVNLTAGTAYEVQLNLPGAAPSKGITFSTWSNTVPVSSTVRVPSGSATYTITQGGSASGYVVYDGTGSTLDAANGQATNINVNASYVIVRGFTLKGAQQHGILIDKNQHDVIIEDNDISGWGRTRDGTWGTDMDSGIRAICVNEELTRVTIQRNRIHDPRYSANSWAVAHPAGPQGVTFSYCGGNNVYRWNEVDGGSKHFNDGIGGEDNFSTAGFPNKDSDVYGNIVMHVWDDGLEIEGGDQNVRIWGNYVDYTGTGISSTIDSVGPLYIFRNVWNHNQFIEGASCDSDQKQPFFKDGSSSDFGNGRRYLFHNTMLQAQQSGCQYGLGGGAGVGGTGDSQLVHNTVSMNNIYHLWKPNALGYQIGTDNTFQNDMYNGSTGGTAVISGINATPTYAAGNGWQSGSGGQYALAAGTPGYDQAARIPNFNDNYLGAAPDVGAAEAGAPAMKFGIAAATSSSSNGGSSGGGTTVPTPTPTPTPAPTPTPTPTQGAGSASISGGMDSSSYTINAGQGVTFTATVSGGSGAPTGSVTFRDNGNAIASCTAVAVSSGTATCTTSALVAGSHAISGQYWGDSVYGTGIVGPITEIVNAGTGAVTADAGVNVQGLWWGAANGSQSGWGLNLVQQGATVFATWFTYDTDGSGMWLVMPNGAPSGNNTYTGALYRTTGPSITAATFNPAQVGVTSVGTASFSFTDSNTGTFTAVVNGSTLTKSLTREIYNGTAPTCAVGVSAGSTPNYQDLWWQASGAESGWGLNVTHQGDILFATWFTYDANGRGLWLVASNLAKVGTATYTGTLYRTTGPAFNSAQWDPSAVTATPVGTLTLTFGDASHGTLSATVNGASVTKAIAREVFATPPSVCS